jgi:hypothetical protein
VAMVSILPSRALASIYAVEIRLTERDQHKIIFVFAHDKSHFCGEQEHDVNRRTSMGIATAE